MVTKTKQNSPIKEFIIIGRCCCDKVVKYPFYWCEELIDEANKIGLNVIDLKKENFIEEKISKQIKKHNPRYVFLNGHGDDFSAMGFKKSSIITANKNDHLLIGRVAHILSCKTGNFLAQSAMDKGCEAYLGYKDNFYIWFIEEDPKNDVIATMFQEAVNIASKILMNGGEVKEAFEQSQWVYEKNINDCKGRYFNPSISEEMRDNLKDIITALIWNKKHQIYFSTS
ncbi:hypothetical protein HZA98_01155 [Candidatus Woesearchaeota archaeon]|nr:hypothetical protein [Candidatus Woesearchaeota archaeon]